MITSGQLKTLRKQFWELQQHTYLPEASLIADKRSTAMFNLAGMQQLIPYLAGKSHPLGKRLFNIQKCIRTNDIDEVGDATHLTMFEMMGNRSLGDYFKKESIAQSRAFLTDKQRLGLDPNKIAITVFAGDENAPRDDESANYRKEVGATKISYLGADDNRRSPGPVGPCGPDTEIFYWIGDKNGGPALPPATSDVASEPDNWMEIWNNVFMEYYRDEQGVLTKLPAQNVDTGMGFDRMCMVLQDKTSPYETDIFIDIIQYIKSHTNVPYHLDNIKHIRIFADHFRTSTMLIAAGLYPSNEKHGYVLRRLIRRFFYKFSAQAHNIMSQEFIKNMVELVYKSLHMGYIEKNGLLITDILLKEIAQFQKTLSNGQKEFGKIISQEQTANNKQINGSDVFKLYDTFGFPYELTKELAQEAGFTIDEEGFHGALQEQKNRSRQASKGKFTLDIDWSNHIQGMPATQFVGYDTLHLTSGENIILLKDFQIHDQRILIFDRSPFYPEGGGQTADKGMITLDTGEQLLVQDVKKYEGVFLHFVS